jgi:carbon monoxide dehydrogenase subunit G
MIIEGEHIFHGPREVVFSMFRDPEVLATAVPGMEKLTKVDDEHYEGTMNVRIGPVSGKFAGVLAVTNEVFPESCTLTVDGRGAAGFGKGVGNVQFKDQGDGTTLLKYSGELNIGGTLASVGQRMIDSVAKSMMKTAFETLDKALEMKMVEKNTGIETKFEAPTQDEFAKSVAKDWIKGALKIAEVRMILYVVPVALIILVIARLLKSN